MSLVNFLLRVYELDPARRVRFTHSSFKSTRVEYKSWSSALSLLSRLCCHFWLRQLSKILFRFRERQGNTTSRLIFFCSLLFSVSSQTETVRAGVTSGPGNSFGAPKILTIFEMRGECSFACHAHEHDMLPSLDYTIIFCISSCRIYHTLGE